MFRLITVFLLFSYSFVFSKISVLEDTPTVFRASINPLSSVILSNGGKIQWYCQECIPETKDGLAKRPYISFLIGVSDALPQVSFKNVRWKEPVIGYLETVSVLPSNATSESKVDLESLPPSALNMQPIVSEISLFRGIKTRSILIPLATWNKQSRSFRMIESVEVEVSLGKDTFSNSHSVLPSIVLSHIFNPKGTSNLQNSRGTQVLKKGVGSSVFKRALSTSSKLNYPYVKIKIGDDNVESLSEDGFYRLTFDDISSLFTSISDVQVPVVRLKMLVGAPELTTEVPSAIVSSGNLRELPIKIIDQGSLGTFDSGDEILFFVQGTSRWKPIKETMPNSIPIAYEFENDEYSFFNYYYLELFGNENGLRLDTVTFVPKNLLSSQTQSWHYLRAEKELSLGYCDLVGGNDFQTGKIWSWFGEESTPFSVCRDFLDIVRGIPKIIPFTISGSKIPFDEGPLNGYQDTASIYLGFFTNFKKSQSVFNLELNEGTPVELNIPKTIEGIYFEFAGRIDSAFKIKQLIFRADDLNSGLDGYSLIYKKAHIKPTKPYYLYPSKVGFSKYSVEGSVLNDFISLKVKNGIPLYYLNVSQNSFIDSIVDLQDNIQYYLSLPSFNRLIKKEDIKLEGIKNGVVQDFENQSNNSLEYLIIAPDAFMDRALELKRFWSEEHPYRSYKVGVVVLSDIYRHFSSGRVSPVAIRDFIRWAVNGWGGAGINSDLKFVTLFGDGCFNYRKILRTGDTKERFDALCRIPPFNKQYMSTDDFYAYLDEGEKVFVRGDEGGSITLDVIIGRLPISSETQAQNYLSKLRAYYNVKNYGYWRNIYLSTADDDRQIFNQDPILGHVNGAESMARLFQSQDTSKEINRNYLLDYTHNFNFKKPPATTRLISQINQGVLVFNYIGHGDYFVYADEEFLKYPVNLNSFQNNFRNFLLTAFSCTIGRFDLAGDFGLLNSDISLSEGFLVDLQTRGSISSFVAGRESLSGLNEALGNNFFARVLEKNNEGRVNTIGDAMLISKNNNNISGYIRNVQKYFILGEPVIELARPNLEVSLENEHGNLDTLSALECQSFNGKIKGGSGFGKVTARIYSQDTPKTISSVAYSDTIFQFNTQNYFINGTLLFENTVEYANGQFKMPYFLGSSLSLGDSNATLQLYAWDTKTLEDGGMRKTKIHLLGTSNTCDTTNREGPKITVSGCNRSESSLIDIGNQVTIPKPYCLEVLLQDSIGGVVNSGINEFRYDLEEKGGQNVLSGLGSNIISENSFNVKSFIIQLDTTIPSGFYLLYLTGFDGFGNGTFRELELTISDDVIYELIDAFNAPNPIKDRGTCFYFGAIGNETSPLLNLDQGRASVNIYNQKGILVRSLRNMRPQEFSQIFNENICRSRNAWWDGKDYLGNQLPNGVYFFKLNFVQQNNFDQSVFRQDAQRGTIVISR